MAHSYPKGIDADILVARFAENIRGKVVLTTGVSPGGLGATFVEAIARASPKLLILAGRSSSKVEATASKIKEINAAIAIRVLPLDLASFASCRSAAAAVNAYPEPLDVLVNNAGIMAVPYAQTEDGLESQFQANHLGHFLLTNLLMPKLLAAGPGRQQLGHGSPTSNLTPRSGSFRASSPNGGVTAGCWPTRCTRASS